MADEFNPINTQEEFDAAVRERYGDVENLQGQITTLTGERDTHATTIANLQKEINGYKTAELKQRIAKEKGIPMEMASRLSGESEKDIRADADTMAGMLRAYKGAAPLADHEPKVTDEKTAAMKKMLHNMKGE